MPCFLQTCSLSSGYVCLYVSVCPLAGSNLWLQELMLWLYTTVPEGSSWALSTITVEWRHLLHEYGLLVCRCFKVVQWPQWQETNAKGTESTMYRSRNLRKERATWWNVQNKSLFNSSGTWLGTRLWLPAYPLRPWEESSYPWSWIAWAMWCQAVFGGWLSVKTLRVTDVEVNWRAVSYSLLSSRPGLLIKTQWVRTLNEPTAGSDREGDTEKPHTHHPIHGY